jgi:hypothetical protein
MPNGPNLRITNGEPNIISRFTLPQIILRCIFRRDGKVIFDPDFIAFQTSANHYEMICCFPGRVY